MSEKMIVVDFFTIVFDFCKLILIFLVLVRTVYFLFVISLFICGFYFPLCMVQMECECLHFGDHFKTWLISWLLDPDPDPIYQYQF
jgi:hypothetical protein